MDGIWRMDSSMEFCDFSGADEMTIFNDSPVVHEQSLSAIALHRHQFTEPNRITAGPNRHAVGTGIGGHELSHGLMTGKNHQYQSTSPLEAQTAEMTNVHNSSSVNVPQAMYQLAGSSPPSKDESNQKKLAKQRSGLKYRKKKQQEMVDLKRMAVELTQKNEVLVLLEDQNASLKKAVDKLAKDLKKYKKDVCQWKDREDGLTTTITEICKALAESKHVDVQRENEQLKQENALLIDQINNPNTMDIIQLKAKIVQLESEVTSRQLVIDALCKKMKTDN